MALERFLNNPNGAITENQKNIETLVNSGKSGFLTFETVKFGRFRDNKWKLCTHIYRRGFSHIFAFLNSFSKENGAQ